MDKECKAFNEDWSTISIFAHKLHLLTTIAMSFIILGWFMKVVPIPTIGYATVSISISTILLGFSGVVYKKIYTNISGLINCKATTGFSAIVYGFFYIIIGISILGLYLKLKSIKGF